MCRLLACIFVLIGLLIYASNASALIPIEHCSTYTISSVDQYGSPVTWYGEYCWTTYIWEPPTPEYDPPDIPDLPGGTPPASDPLTCEAILDSWPENCSQEAKPQVLSHPGCTGIPEAIANVSITDACNTHDACYGTVGSSKTTCDSDFGTDIAILCTQYYAPLITNAPNSQARFELFAAMRLCGDVGDVYANGLSNVASYLYFDPAQDNAACIKAHEDRDQYCDP